MDVNATLAERETTHGDFITQGTLANTLKELVRNQPTYKNLQPHQREALDIGLTKVARIVCGNAQEKDHWLDLAGYATLGARGIKG